LMIDLFPTIAAAVLLVLLWHEFAPRHDLAQGHRERQLGRYAKILNETSLLFSADLAGVVLAGKEVRIETAKSSENASGQAVLVEIGKRGERVRVLTYSGRRVPLTFAGETMTVEVMESGSGAIMVVGPDFVW